MPWLRSKHAHVAFPAHPVAHSLGLIESLVKNRFPPFPVEQKCDAWPPNPGYGDGVGGDGGGGGDGDGAGVGFPIFPSSHAIIVFENVAASSAPCCNNAVIFSNDNPVVAFRYLGDSAPPESANELHCSA